MGQTASHLNGMGNQLIKASKAGDADAVTELVSTNPQLLRFCTFRHLGPAHYAARGDHVEVLQQLVAKAQEVEQLQWQEAAAGGAKVHARLFGTPLDPQLEQQHHRRRSSMEHDSLVKQVVNAASDRGITPLMLAVDGGCVASVKLLLEKVHRPVSTSSNAVSEQRSLLPVSSMWWTGASSPVQQATSPVQHMHILQALHACITQQRQPFCTPARTAVLWPQALSGCSAWT